MSGFPGVFYGADQARIHHERFGDLATGAASLVEQRLTAGGLDRGHVTDLGCGSGILAAALLDAGYAISGLDLSEDMIALARVTAPGGRFAVGSVHEAEIPASVAVTAIGEVLNYATDPRAGLLALGTVANKVHAALDSGGIFVFDVATPGRNFGLDVRHVFHDHDTWMLGMHATETAGKLDRRIVILIRDADGRYRRVDEHHVLVLYEVTDVVAELERTGFTVDVRLSYAEGATAATEATAATGSTPPSGWAVFVAAKAHRDASA